MTDWQKAHERVLELFTKGWAQPHPHAWDDLVAEDVEVVQPFLRDGRGREVWHEEARRLLSFAPDLAGEVLAWAARDEVMFINWRIRATVGGKPLEIPMVDQLRIDASGVVVRREAFFDSWPVASELLRRPAAWLPWWRSGMAPLLARRRLLRS